MGRRKTADDVLAGRDLRGRVILVTGGDSGIGKETVRALAAHGARVYLGCVRELSGRVAADEIVRAHPGADVRAIAFDLGDLDAVARAVASLDEPVLHALVCNAGVYGGPYATTKDGFERTLGVCFVGHAALVFALEEKLVRGAPSRVVMVSSDNHRWPRTFDWDDFPVSAARYSELRAYGQAKLACVTFANALDARWKDRGVRGWSLHPGDLVRTAIDGSSWVLRAAMWAARPFSPSIGEAAATSVYLATSPEVEGRGGAYFARMREVAPSPAALVPENQSRLWDLAQRWAEERRP